jgi:hypothetical protein
MLSPSLGGREFGVATQAHIISGTCWHQCFSVTRVPAFDPNNNISWVNYFFRFECEINRTYKYIHLFINILCNVRVLDQFWPPIVQCYATEDAVQIVNSFYYNLPHVTTFTHNHLLTLCHIYTAYNLTRQYSILDVYTYTYTLQIKPSHLETLAENWLCEFTS